MPEKQIYRKFPAACTKRECLDFRKVVIAGGQVQTEGLSELIRKALWLGFANINGALVSVAAIKEPRESYKKRVFQKAKSPDDQSRYTLEFGWAHTLEGYEGNGLGSGVADALLADIEEPIFATTGKSNEVMQHILTKRGFRQSGSPYQGREETRVLFVRK